MKSIAQKEFISTLRDTRFVVLSALVLALLLAATLVGRASYRTLQQERQLAQGTVNEQFRNQPARHPHRVAHYGSFAFRPKSGLSLLDSGVDSFTGSAVYLEAHQQNSVNFSAAQQSGSLLRFGEMTVAFVLQLLVPLLIIFLCFGAFTQERETGTLKLLLSQGVTMRQVAWGKIRGYGQAVALVVAPALLLAAALLFTGEQQLQGTGFALLGNLLPNLNLNATYAFNYSEVLDAALPVEEGQPLANAPKHSAGLWTKYTFVTPALRGLGVAVGGNYVSQRRTENQVVNTSTGELYWAYWPSYTVLDAALFYTTGKFNFHVNLNNLLDKYYFVGGYDFFRASPGAPRNFMATVGYTF